MEKKSKQVCGKQYPHRIFAALPLIFRITILKIPLTRFTLAFFLTEFPGFANLKSDSHLPKRMIFSASVEGL